MTTKLTRVLLILALCGLPLLAAACGDDDEGGGAATRGGTLKTEDTAGGVDSLDPGYWY